MIRKYAIQIIGIALAASGVYDLYHDVYLNIVPVPELTAKLFLRVCIAFVFCVMAVYGGIQLVKLQEVGRKLAVISFFWILFVIVTREFPDYWSGKSPFLELANRKYLILLTSIYLLYILAFVFLTNHKFIEIMGNNATLMQRAGKILSYCMPGLGRALTGNFWVGMGLFICYLYLLMSLFSRQDLISTIFLVFLVWRIFSWIDIVAVKDLAEIEQTEVAFEKDSG